MEQPNDYNKEKEGHEELTKAKKKRGIIKASITRIGNFVYNFDGENLERLAPRLEALRQKMEEFEVTQTFLELNSDESEEHANYREELEETVYDLKSRIQSFLKKENKSTIVHSTSERHLPVINLGTFEGNVSKYQPFIALYNSLIHNNKNLSNAEKFQYLLSCLKSPALDLISNIPITEETYITAYETLTKRYSNHRLLAAHFFHEIKNFQPIDKNRTTFDGLQKFLACHSNCFNALKQLKEVDLGDFLQFSLALCNLDSQTRSIFENQLGSQEFPTLDRLLQFVTERLRSLEIRQLEQPESSSSKPVYNKNRNLIVHHDNSIKRGRNSSLNFNQNLNSNCVMCTGSHDIGNCSKFSSLTVQLRYEEVKRLHLCYRCLKLHKRIDCKETKTCHHCNSTRHHSLLHYQNNYPGTSINEEQHPHEPHTSSDTTTSIDSSDVKTVLLNSNSTSTLLGTALVHTFDKFRKQRNLRAVIDSGSEVNTITRSAVARLQLPIQKIPTIILGFGANSTNALGTTCLRISSRVEPDFFMEISALVVKEITGNLPACNLPPLPENHQATRCLADTSFNISRPVDILLGCNIFVKSLFEEGRNLIPGEPYAINTKFGWIILGDVNVPFSSPKRTLLTTSIDAIGDALIKFWKSEEIAETSTPHPDDIKCEEIYKSTTERLPDGSYQTGLPFCNEEKRPGSNKVSTLKKYYNFERRMLQDNDLRDKYVKFMEEYKSLNHMEVTETPSAYVIPFHCVLRPSSTSTKLRTVFNGSNVADNELSLNDCLLSGPKLQQDLPSIILNFRLHNIVICTDIKMMFRKIYIRPCDREYQHIFYRSSPDEELQEFQLNTVVYGLTCSPFLAQRTLNQLVEDEGKCYPMAVTALKNFTYVDDIACGVDSVKDAHHLVEELIALLKQGNFELRKWSSNCKDVLAEFPTDYLENPHSFTDDKATVKILGLEWLPSPDEFYYSTGSPFEGKPTKRNILSYIARTFDVVGFLCPVIFWMKTFLQKLWISKIDWDSELPKSLNEEWYNFANSLTALKDISIPRQISNKHAIKRLVGFSDASEKGFSGCIYLHSTYDDGSVSMYLLTAKSKVAPLQVTTIPKLELCGALLLVRLVKSVLSALKTTEIMDIRLYTDAKTVLHWLSTPPYLLKIYVGNRVSKILEMSTRDMWNYIGTKSNPSDIASRGCSADVLLNSDLWWKGPIEFHTTIENWPISKPIEPKGTIPELKPTKDVVLNVCKTYSLLESLERFSTYRKTINVFAYVLRFVRRCQQKRSNTSTLTVEELNDSKLLCVKLVQEQSFNLKSIENYKSLSLFVDHHGLYRVGGRIRNSTLTYDSQHPLLLPKRSHFTNLVCDHFHKIALHAGPRTTQSLILQQYWIVSIRNVLRQVIQKCVRCFRFRGKPNQPIMADLPSFRITKSRPFSNVGIDFCGPFICKTNPLRSKKTYKGYLCVFVCMSTKAAHLEFLSELSTAAFLAAFDRFISRRGLPRNVYSDNGTNFQGAARQLKEVWNMLTDGGAVISSTLASKMISWHFNPPTGSNFGGLWEVTIKITKAHLKTIIGNSILSYEEYATLFCRIEAILNSRPLLDFSPDANEQLTTITPAHFLIGTSLFTPAEIDYSECKTLKSKWMLLKQLTQRFWKIWSKDYIHTQMQRGKWQKPCENLKIGQIVYVYGQNTSPLDWPLGVIQELLPGKDGIVRVAKVKTANKVLTRPVNKLVLLPSNDL